MYNLINQDAQGAGGRKDFRGVQTMATRRDKSLNSNINDSGIVDKDYLRLQDPNDLSIKTFVSYRTFSSRRCEFKTARSIALFCGENYGDSIVIL